MPKLKLYLRTKGKIGEMIQAYEKVFNAQVIKKSFLNKGDIELNKPDTSKTISYANLNILNNITIMIACYHKKFPAFGYNQDNIIFLEDDHDTFIKIYEKMVESPDFTIDYAPMKQEWGTTIVKAYDKWGYGWILEVRT